MNNTSIVYNKNIKDKIDSQELLKGVYIISTPIGNILDITIRAISILNVANIILCEDTRVTMKLLQFYGIENRKLVCFNDITENKNLEKYINMIKENGIVAVVSDAGTPMISDPGFKLVREITKLGMNVFSVPGPSAAISALTLSALPTDSFFFYGFLSPKNGKKLSELQLLHTIKTTIIIYESPFKVINTLHTISEVFGNDVEISVSREITKKFEETLRGKICNVIAIIRSKSIKGEFIIIINNRD